MKKLMITAAVALAAVASQAAAINWATSSAVYGPSITTESPLAYNSSYGVGSSKAKAYFDAGASVTITLTHGEVGDTDYWTETKTSAIAWGGTGKAMASDVVFDNLVLTGTGVEVSYMIRIDAAKTDVSGKFDFSSNRYTGTATLSTASNQLTTGQPSSWSTTPEPTSGLLLLVGMAGLALRRRRA